MRPPVFNNRWPEQVQHLYEHDIREIWDRRIAPQIWNQYHHQLDLYQHIVGELRPKTILDVGCAQGTLALLLAEAGYSVVANDLRPEFLDYAKSRYEKGDIQFVVGNIFEVKLEKKFDLIFANQIIEHLVYPVDFLRQLSGLLNPGGHVVVTTPNHSYFKNDLPTYTGIGDPAQHVDRQFTADADGHFFAYTAEELTESAKAAGFTHAQPFFFETPWISGHFKVRYLHGLAPVALLKLMDKFTRAIPAVERRACHQLGIIAQWAV